MSLKDTFARGFVWKLAALLALVVFGWLTGTGNAQAHTPNACGNSATRTCDKGQALAASKDIENAIPHCTSAGVGPAQGYTQPNWQPVFLTHAGGSTDTQGNYTQQYAMRYTPNGAQTACGSDSFYYGGSCNSRTDQTTESSQLATTKCIAGCEFKAQTGFTTRTNVGMSDGTTNTVYRAIMEWTGNTCTGGTPSQDYIQDSKPKEQECVAAGSGQSFCVKKSGENCYTATSGRMMCWQPGETGQKTDASLIQVAATGNSPPPAPLSPAPPGQSWVQGPGSTNVTTTTNTTTNVTNITNFLTSGGSTAGSTNSGEGNTGLSGDGQCTSNCSTGTAGGTGSNVDLTETNGLLTAIKTAVEKTREFFDGIGTEAGGLDTTEGATEDPMSIWGVNPSELDLDASGFGAAGGSCPPPPTYMGYSLDAGGYMCLFATIIGTLVLAAGYVQAAYIIGRA